MQEFESNVSPKGQITIPKELRDRLRLKPKDRVTIRLEEDVVTLTPARFTLEAIYQSVAALGRRLTTAEMTEIAAEEHAAHAVREGLPQN